MKFIKLTTYRCPKTKYYSRIKFSFIEISKITSLEWCELDSKTYLLADKTTYFVLETPEQIIELMHQIEGGE
jgi:hypothetical protein